MGENEHEVIPLLTHHLQTLLEHNWGVNNIIYDVAFLRRRLAVNLLQVFLVQNVILNV